MGSELRFDGKVAIVTGAGAGLGRSHALLLASRGAKVVVNDLGGSHTGEGKSSSAADKVVEEIKAAGGTAVANYDSVVDGDKIVKTAIDAFGRIDIVVNNAGILRDTSFQKMSQQDWDLIYTVHVLGAYRVTAAAWPYLRDQKYGRVIFTSSAAGIYGNFGQANYSMAKLGTFGFAQTLAIEGRKNNVLVNTIAPIAGSRMTETVLPKELLESLKPEYVSTLVACLAHEGCTDTGGLFEVGGGFYSKLRWERTEGKTFRMGRPVTPENLKDAWSTVTDFGKSTHPGSVAESMSPIMKNVEAGPSKGGNQFIDVDAALGYELPETESAYTGQSAAFYALGVGAGRDPMDPKELALVYEMNGAGFYPLPTMTAAITVQQIMKLAMEGKSAPGLNYGLDRVLHGEQYTEVMRPLPASQKLKHRSKIKSIFDKGKGATVVQEIKSYDEDGDLLAVNEVTTFVRGAGGFGGDRGPSSDVNVAPDRKPDAVIEEKTSPDQALLYRLNGDINPLHADPGFAKNFGFEKPILHGLCSFGFAARHVIKAFAGNDPRYFKSIRVRFVEPVIPGETLITEMWKDGDQKILFRVKVKERDKVVMSNSAIELFKEIPKKIEKPKAAAGAAAGVPSEPISADIFAGIGKYVEKNKADATRVGVVYQFKLSNPESVWTLDLKGGSVAKGETAKPECTLELSDADFLAMTSGKADAMKLFTSGKLKISGNIMASQKLELLKKVDPNDVLAAMRARGGGGGAAAAAPAATAEPMSGDIFGGIARFFEKNTADVTKIGVVFQFKLASPDSTWTLDTKTAKVAQGESAKPECTLELSDADFMAMCTGKADPMKLFTSGKLKIAGNIMASQKLDFLKKVDPNDVIAAMQARGGGSAAAAAGGAAAAAPAGGGEPTSADIFGGIERYVGKNKEAATKIGVVYQFKLSAPDSTWTLDLKAGTVATGETAKPECTLELADTDFMAMCTGKADPMKLFTSGKLKIQGNIMASQKLDFLKKIDPSDVVEAMKARAAAGGGAAAAPAASGSGAKEAKAPTIFKKLAERLAQTPALAGELGAVVQFKITGPDGAWTVDCSKSPGTVQDGTAANAAATFTLSDADLAAMTSGGKSAYNLFMHGTLRIDGDIRIAHRLGLLNKL